MKCPYCCNELEVSVEKPCRGAINPDDESKRRECISILRTMPPKYCRNDKSADDSMHAWARSMLPVSTAFSDLLVDTSRRASTRKVEQSTLVNRRDERGVIVYAGRDYVS
jgi:hypothetical protein